MPATTTEALPLENVRSVELSIRENGTQEKIVTLPVPIPGPATSEVRVSDWVGKSITLSVRVTGPKGKASEWSNPASLAVIPPLPAPSTPKPQNVEGGVELSWTGPGQRFRIFRAEADGQPAPLADTERSPYIDTSTGFGKRYRYMVQTIAADNQWSLVSAEGEITPVDTFPPAVPEGLSANSTPQSIELSWTRNTETDFRGYNVSRSVDGSPFQKVAELIEAPTYSDSKIEPGKKYRYTVSSIDLTGNESAPSAPAEAIAQ
jgi:hypothetical protein